MNRKHPTILFAAIGVLLILVIAFTIIELTSSAETVPVELPPVTTETAAPGDANSSAYAKVTPKTVQAVVQTLHRPEGYSRTVTVEDFWGDDASDSTEFTVQVSGSNSKITTGSGNNTKHILVTDDGTWIWYGNSGSNAAYLQPKASYSGDQWLRSLTYEDLLELPADAIESAGYEAHNDVWCIYASYRTEHFGYLCTVWISAADGLLAAAEIHDGDTLIYRMTGGTVDSTVPNDSVFDPPA